MWLDRALAVPAKVRALIEATASLVLLSTTVVALSFYVAYVIENHERSAVWHEAPSPSVLMVSDAKNN